MAHGGSKSWKKKVLTFISSIFQVEVAYELNVGSMLRKIVISHHVTKKQGLVTTQDFSSTIL